MKKLLVVGIIILFVGLAVAPSNALYLSKNITESKSNLDRELCDLVIVDVYEGEDNDIPFWYMQAVVKNVGLGTAPYGPDRYFRIVVQRPILGNVVDADTNIEPGRNPVPPGETTKEFCGWLGEPTIMLPGIYKIFYKVDSGNVIPESNEDNNVVWAYYIMLSWFSIFSSPTRISEFHTCSELPSSGYYRSR
jgi:hypothetical protein